MALAASQRTIRLSRPAHTPHLPRPERLTAQRFARQMMTLTTRQLASLAHLKAERRRAAEAKERRQTRERATREQLARGNAFVDEMERMLKAGAAAGATPAAMPGPIPEAAGSATPEPRAVGAAVAKAPAGPEPAMNRQQRRALERQERKRRRRGPAAASREA
ncbi:MAG: hypothetical protein OEU09_20325 [Rhodospirillales bacterium]|nr:hypothetical protein [Rhodospirillales bacterium]